MPSVIWQDPQSGGEQSRDFPYTEEGEQQAMQFASQLVEAGIPQEAIRIEEGPQGAQAPVDPMMAQGGPPMGPQGPPAGPPGPPGPQQGLPAEDMIRAMMSQQGGM